MESLEKQEAKRRQVLEKKEELERKQAQEQIETERALMQRMRKFEKQQHQRDKTLSDAKQNGFRVRDQERRRHSVERNLKESNEAQSCVKTLNSLKDKLQTSYSKSVESAQRRVDHNKQHTEKVESVLLQSILNEQRRVEEQLQKVIEKSKATDAKKTTKESRYKVVGSEVSQELIDKFNKHSQAYSERQSDMKRREGEIEERRKKKEQLKEKLFKRQDALLQRMAERHQLRLQDQAENYVRTKRADMKSKQRVMTKHQRLKEMADMLSTEKSNLANKSVKDALHLQRLRTTGSPVLEMRYRSQSTGPRQGSFEFK